jgi:ribosome-binding ATPase
MQVGIVGSPNVGKSTFFKAATLADVLIANYPFATIKPNHAIAYVKIKDLAVEFDKVSNPREGYVKNGWRFVPFEMYDVAGLVEGASEGKGLGNQFLDDLTSADAMIYVVDMSGETDAEGKPTKEHYPGNDIKIIEDELDKWYLGVLRKVWKTLSRNMEVQKAEFAEGVAKQFSGLKVSEEDVKEVVLNEKLDISRPAGWSDDELMEFARALRRYTKPMIIAANKIDRPKGKDNFVRVKKEFDYPIVPCSAEYELTLKQADKNKLIEYVPGDNGFEIIGELEEKQKDALDNIKKVLKEFGSTGVQEVLNKIVFDLLKYIAVYPAGGKLEDSKGNVLPDCYLMPPGSTALDFAYKIHKDIGDGFVKAINIRTKKAVGKEYRLKNGDGLEIMTR